MSVVQDVVRELVNSRRLASQAFYLVILPEDDFPEIVQFDRVDDLLTRIKSLLDKEVSLFPFMGNHMPITAGANRFLITPYGALPLFDIPDPTTAAVAEHGYVGPPDPSLSIPKTEQPEGQLPKVLAVESAEPAAPDEDDEDDTPTVPTSEM